MKTNGIVETDYIASLAFTVFVNCIKADSDFDYVAEQSFKAVKAFLEEAKLTGHYRLRGIKDE